jgi:Ser/Thr protein kinase RdoA (MazF antagonist)
MTSAWGDDTTRYFHDLTPERILDAVESATGRRCTGRAMALNSMENRVYEIEIELDEADDERLPRTAAERFLIAKFYRPGRWNEAQILEEHRFLADLAEAEIPVVAPLALQSGGTLHRLGDADIHFGVFPKIGGRSPDELGDAQLAQVGRLLARLHGVGAARPARERIMLSPETYGIANLRHLVDSGTLPADIRPAYQQVVETICSLTAPWFDDAGAPRRIHGDCHLGNLLSGRESLFFVDFDDMVRGPAVQDLWLLVPGRDAEACRQLELMLEGYETMRPFDRSTLRLIEPLRALRFVHFSAWIGRRWQDPAFPRAFPQFGTPRYWQEQLADLRDQLDVITNPSEPDQDRDSY